MVLASIKFGIKIKSQYGSWIKISGSVSMKIMVSLLSVDLVHRFSHILIYHFLISDLLLFWSLICWFSDLWFADSWFDLFDLVGVLWKQSPSGFEMYPEGTSLAFRLMNYLYFVWHTTYVLGHHHHRMTTPSSASFYLIRATIIKFMILDFFVSLYFLK